MGFPSGLVVILGSMYFVYYILDAGRGAVVPGNPEEFRFRSIALTVPEVSVLGVSYREGQRIRRVLIPVSLVSGLLVVGCYCSAGGCYRRAPEASPQTEPYHWGMHQRDEDLRRMLWELEHIDRMVDRQTARAR